MELSLNDIKELVTGEQPTTDNGGFVVGKKVFIRTVTHYYLGLVESISATTIVLSSASWVADTGLFSEMLASGTINEVEPYADNVTVSRGAIIDHTHWRHSLPKERK